MAARGSHLASPTLARRGWSEMAMFKKSPTKPAASPARAALAEAIARRDEVAAEIAALRNSVEATTEIVQRTRTARDEAEAALQRAKQDAADHIVAQARGDAGPAPVSVREARAAFEAAGDEVESAEAALAELKRQLDARQQFADLPERRVAEAAAAVLRESPEVAQLLSEVEALQAKLAERGSALAWLAKQGALSLANVDMPGSVSVLSPANLALTRLDSPATTWRGLPGIAEGPLPWQAAFAALSRDANAPIPNGAR
jgi:hypothetical protein